MTDGVHDESALCPFHLLASVGMFAERAVVSQAEVAMYTRGCRRAMGDAMFNTPITSRVLSILHLQVLSVGRGWGRSLESV